MPSKKISENEQVTTLSNDDLIPVSKKKIGEDGYDSRNITKNNLVQTLGLAGAVTHESLQPLVITPDWENAHHPKSHTHNGLDGTPKIKSSDINWDAPPATNSIATHDHSSNETGGKNISHANLINITEDDHHNKDHRHGADGVSKILMEDIDDLATLPHTHGSGSAEGQIPHSNLTGVGENDHHNKIHNHSSNEEGGVLTHADSFAGTEPNWENLHHPKDHLISSHDTTATGSQLNELTSNKSTELHTHNNPLDKWDFWGNDALHDRYEVGILAIRQNVDLVTLEIDIPGRLNGAYNDDVTISTSGVSNDNLFENKTLNTISYDSGDDITTIHLTHTGANETITDQPAILIFERIETHNYLIEQSIIRITHVQRIDDTRLRFICKEEYPILDDSMFITTEDCVSEDHNIKWGKIESFSTMTHPDTLTTVTFVVVSGLSLNTSPISPDATYGGLGLKGYIYTSDVMFSLDTTYVLRSSAFLNIIISANADLVGLCTLTVKCDSRKNSSGGYIPLKIRNKTTISANEHKTILLPIPSEHGFIVEKTNDAGNDVSVDIQIIGFR